MEINPISVSELNNYIKDRFDKDEMLNNVLVKGEISNLKIHYTGHIYFTLKDEASLIKCVMFKTYAGKMNFTPKDRNGSFSIWNSICIYERPADIKYIVKQ